MEIKEKVIEMIGEISTTDSLAEARAECMYAGHLFEKHISEKFNLTAKDMTDIAFTLGRSSQLGVLFGLLWHTNNVSDEVEIEAKELFSKALETGKPSWRKIQ